MAEDQRSEDVDYIRTSSCECHDGLEKTRDQACPGEGEVPHFPQFVEDDNQKTDVYCEVEVVGHAIRDGNGWKAGVAPNVVLRVLNTEGSSTEQSAQVESDQCNWEPPGTPLAGP